jgi:Myb-like DNA-binding protein FlbD
VTSVSPFCSSPPHTGPKSTFRIWHEYSFAILPRFPSFPALEACSSSNLFASIAVLLKTPSHAFHIMGRSTRRGPWLPDEDNTLLELVHLQGPNNWVRISQHMQHRSPKQCRERYHQNLKPSLNHEPISADEGDMIEQLVHDMGKRWAEIARRLGNRSDNAVKNWWNGSMNRRKRTHVAHTASSRGVGLRAEPMSATLPPRPYSTYHDVHSHQRASSYGGLPVRFGHRLPTPDQDVAGTRRPMLPTLNQPYPASVTLLPSPDAFAQQAYHTPQSSLDSRLAPLDWRNKDTIDKGRDQAISPAATDYSNQRAPSLVSDHQSRCSTSPRTIASPRPGLPAPIQTSRTFYEHNRRQSYASIASDGKVYTPDEGYVSALPSSTTVDPIQRRFPFDIPLKSLYSPAVERRTELQLPLPKLSPLAERDTRMNVSRILG